MLNGVVFINPKKAFGTIDHEVLLLKLSNYGVDSTSLRLFESCLTNSKVNDELSNSSRLTCGIPQGSSFGLLLFFFYINDLLNCLDMAQPRMFADDTSVSDASGSLDEIQNVINSELKNLNSWLIANRLSLNITKTEFVVIGSPQRMNATQNDIAVRIHDREINRVEIKSLGMHIDRHLSWSEHIHKISKKISSTIGTLKRARPFISCKTAVQVYTALIQPHFDYCCSVWDELGGTLVTKLRKLQNRAARVITRCSYDAHAGTLLTLLQLDNLSIRRKGIKVQLMFKILKGNAPSYLKSFFSVCTLEYDLRNNGSKLHIPKPRTSYLK